MVELPIHFWLFFNSCKINVPKRVANSGRSYSIQELTTGHSLSMSTLLNHGDTQVVPAQLVWHHAGDDAKTVPGTRCNPEWKNQNNQVKSSGVKLMLCSGKAHFAFVEVSRVSPEPQKEE